MKHTLKLYISKYMNVNGKYETVEVSKTFTFSAWDDIQNLIRYLNEGSDGPIKFETDTIEEEA